MIYRLYLHLVCLWYIQRAAPLSELRMDSQRREYAAQLRMLRYRLRGRRGLGHLWRWLGRREAEIHAAMMYRREVRYLEAQQANAWGLAWDRWQRDSLNNRVIQERE